MREVPIPGGTAFLKDKDELRGRDSKLIKAAVLSAQGALRQLGDEATIKKGETKEQAGKRLEKYLEEHPLNLSEEDAFKMMTLKEATVVAYLDHWTLDIPVPRTTKELGDLPGPIYDALDEAVGGDLLDATSNVVDTDVNPDKSSPTGPSSSSDGDLRAEESDPTLTSTR